MTSIFKTLSSIVFFFLLIFCVFSVSAQIHGLVQYHNEPVAFADVLLINSVDSTLVSFSYTSDEGRFEFIEPDHDRYFVQISYLGLEDYITASFLYQGGNSDLGIITMMESAVHINELLVLARKPLLEIKSDMMVLNVSNSVLANGDDAFSLLRKAPGVVIDNNENLTLLGKSGVMIYIDGKPSPLSSADLSNYLKTLSSDDIESIEIISNPSAKYDAQGSAGIINIKRKKLKNQGLNGTIDGAVRQGRTFGHNYGVKINYMKDNLNLFSSLSYYDNDNWNFNDFFRRQNGLGIKTFNTNHNNSHGLNAKLNMDYRLSNHSTLGLIAESNFNNFEMNNDAETFLGDENLLRIDSILINQGAAMSHSDNYNFNLNYYYDYSATKFNVDVNYGFFIRENNNYTPNLYYTPDRDRISSRSEIRIITPTDIKLLNAKMDYEKKFKKSVIELGAKSALVETTNNFRFYNFLDGMEVLNNALSNNFDYNEWVNAVYGRYSYKAKKWGFNAGMRLESSHTKGHLKSINAENEEIVERNYIDIFPNLGISFTPSAPHSFQMSYGRRINRPNYQDLNPFEFQLDELTFEKGNPFLNPEYTSNIQVSHTYNYKLTTTLSYSHTTDVITRIIDTARVNASFITWDNIASRTSYSISASMPLAITDKWSVFTNLSVVYANNQADFGEGKLIDLDVTSFNAFHQQSYKLPGNFSIEMSAWYMSPSIWEGSFIMRSMWSVSTGISKRLPDNIGRISLNFDDLFLTNAWEGKSIFGGLVMNANGGWDSRRVRLSASYNFGKQFKSKTRNRNTGLEDEQGRIKK
jgi:iron complex outermembrane recepter protein